MVSGIDAVACDRLGAVSSIDHVILGVRDLDAVTRRLEDMGFGVVDGGRHLGLGTANRIVPFGGSQYLEILGVVDPVEARQSLFGRALVDATADGDRLVRWCIEVDDLEAVAARLGLTVEPRSRRLPDGVLLTWRAAGLTLSLVDGWLPFFVAWDHPERHPGRAAVRHRRRPTGFTRLDLSTSDASRLERWLAGTDLPVRVVDGHPGLHHVAIETDDGEVIVGAGTP